MILNVTVNNFMVFSNEVELSLRANRRVKQFEENVYEHDGFRIVKCAGIYGPNNVGKTCFVDAINQIKNVMLGHGILPTIGSMKNKFTDDNEISLGIVFLQDDIVYSYNFRYCEAPDSFTRGAVTYEKLSKVRLSPNGKNDVMKTIYLREKGNPNSYFHGDSYITKMIGGIVDENILPFSINPDTNENIRKYRELFINFANSIEVIYPDQLTPYKTIDELKKGKDGYGEDIVNIIKSVDVDIDDYTFDEKRDSDALNKMRLIDKSFEQQDKRRDDMFHLYSKHNGQDFESVIYDSMGTKIIASLSSYIVDALYNNKTLVIDEIDSSLHFKVIRAFVAAFNSHLNNHAQLIYTCQNTDLLDLRHMFRKEQIWFMDKEKVSKTQSKQYLYCLDEFSSDDDGIRSNTNIEEIYKSGYFGSLPNPDIFDVMEHIREKSGQ